MADGDEASTIFAPATAPGKAGVAVIRISGPKAWGAVQTLSGGAPLPEPRRLGLRRLVAGGEALDDALVVGFEAGASFTGEKSAELHLHGGPAVVAKLLKEMDKISGLRHAEAGEFTRRALGNGRMDLAAVEGLADLIDAETEAQRRQALALKNGALSRAAGAWRETMVHSLALIEASIDFADEEDAPEDVSEEVDRHLAHLARVLGAAVDGAAFAARVREGFEVALVGAPNAGKSSLLNALSGRDAAITSPKPGTTRDVIEVRCDIGGLPVTLLDLAGLRATDDDVEAIGVGRATERALAADLRIFVRSPDVAAAAGDVTARDGDILVCAKSDIEMCAGAEEISVSSVSGEGVDEVAGAIHRRLQGRSVGSALAARDRQRRLIESARDDIASAMEEAALELKAARLLNAVHALDELVGAVDVEHVLDEIFSRFCIGK